jgi:excisionase family DNA binding protein
MDGTTRLAHSPKEAAALLSMSRRSIDYLLKSGKLRGVQAGRRILIPHRELEKFLTVGTATLKGA